jgi:hypothetical protein
MPRGVKRGPVEGEAEVVVRAGASPSQTKLLDDSPSQPISYHLLDHGYGATPQHQIRREAPSAPPKTSEVSCNILNPRKSIRPYIDFYFLFDVNMEYFKFIRNISANTLSRMFDLVFNCCW